MSLTVRTHLWNSNPSEFHRGWPERTQKPLSDAPPAMAIMPTLESVSSNRVILTFIGLILLELPGLASGLGSHVRPPTCGLRAKHENRPFTGRSVALVAQPHPKCPFQAGLQRVRVTVTYQYWGTSK